MHTDDELVISQHAEETLRELWRYFELKEESIGPPKMFLGGHCRKFQLENGVEAWAFSSSQHVQCAVKNVEENVKDKESLSYLVVEIWASRAKVISLTPNGSRIMAHVRAL